VCDGGLQTHQYVGALFFSFDLEAYRKVAGVGNSVHDIEPTSCLFFLALFSTSKNDHQREIINKNYM